MTKPIDHFQDLREALQEATDITEAIIASLPPKPEHGKAPIELWIVVECLDTTEERIMRYPTYERAKAYLDNEATEPALLACARTFATKGVEPQRRESE